MPGIEISLLPPIIGSSALTDVLPTDQLGHSYRQSNQSAASYPISTKWYGANQC